MEIFILILVVGAGVAFGLMQKDNRLQDWQEAAVSSGLQVVEALPHFNPQLRARGGLLEVRIEASGSKEEPTRIAVEIPGPPNFRSVRIRESMFTFAPEIQIEDAAFDAKFFIEGPERLVSALLDEEMRRLLSRASTLGQFELSSGELKVDLSDGQVAGALPFLLDLGKRLAAPLDVPRRLAENARQDAEAGVRLKNLLLLVRELPSHPETAEALRKACSDPSPAIRLRAAKEVGAEGRATLLELAKNLQDDAVSAEAVSLLDRELPFESAKSILVQALSLQRMQTTRACLEALGRSGATAVDALAGVLASRNIELATAAAQALGATGSPAAEPALILALQREKTDLQVAAANALARVGSAAAVLPLKDANERSRLDLKLRRAVRQAIAEIQSRLQGASPGQLSLAGAEAGQLSLTEGEAGQLSLATDPAGQLSLGDDQ